MPAPRLAIVGVLMLVACSGRDQPSPDPDCADAAGADCSGPAADTSDPQPYPGASPNSPVGGWEMQSSGEGTSLVFPGSGDPAIRLFCPTGANRILVNVSGFRPVGSEERMTFGSVGNAHTLVADTRGDRQRGGVSGSGAVPANLAALIGEPVSVNYGSQNSGPHPAPPQDLARDLVSHCREGAPGAAPAPTPSPTGNVSACLMQGRDRLTNPPLRALGTEPFWAASIEGRCVTYSHPENQQGTRVWAKFSPQSGGVGTWRGVLEGQSFVLTTHLQPGCSDGMSDTRYPIGVELTVGGEQRRGCAERL